jgi:hypothetical protein
LILLFFALTFGGTGNSGIGGGPDRSASIVYLVAGLLRAGLWAGCAAGQRHPHGLGGTVLFSVFQ